MSWQSDVKGMEVGVSVGVRALYSPGARNGHSSLTVPPTWWIRLLRALQDTLTFHWPALSLRWRCASPGINRARHSKACANCEWNQALCFSLLRERQKLWNSTRGLNCTKPGTLATLVHLSGENGNSSNSQSSSLSQIPIFHFGFGQFSVQSHGIPSTCPTTQMGKHTLSLSLLLTWLIQCGHHSPMTDETKAQVVQTSPYLGSSH